MKCYFLFTSTTTTTPTTRDSVYNSFLLHNHIHQYLLLFLLPMSYSNLMCIDSYASSFFHFIFRFISLIYEIPTD